MSAEVSEFIARVEHPVRRRDAETLVRLMARATQQEPEMWGSSIIGYGSYHYRYESGREGDAPAAGFSPRKPATTVFLADGLDAHSTLIQRLGPHKVGVGCVYLKDLSENDLDVLEEVVRRSYDAVIDGKYFQRAREGAEESAQESRRVPLSKNEKVELLKRTALFAGCTKADLIEVAINADERVAPAVAMLTEEGQRGREFFVLVDGDVVVRRRGRKVADLGPGDWFGEIAILTHGPRTATVTTTSPVRLLVVGDSAFRRVVETRPRIALHALRSVAERLEHDARS